MQLTLVSHYGQKPPEFARLIHQLQQLLTKHLDNHFAPYAIEQVHATIIGLEGVRVASRIRHEHFRQVHSEERFIDFDELIIYLRSPSFPKFSVQVGGFQPRHDFQFTSQGQHPFMRSFSIQNEIAVGMGWPRSGNTFPDALDQLRRHFPQYGVLHKWHRRNEDVDNDFFFVLGRVGADIPDKTRHRAEEEIRHFLGSSEGCVVPFSTDSLFIVAYTDAQLPPGQSRAWSVKDKRVTPDLLASVYD